MTPPTRRAYSLRQTDPPNESIDTPFGRPVMYALSSFPPKASTTARGRSSFMRCSISSNQLNTSGRVSPVATLPSTPPTDSIAGLAPAARTTAKPGVMTRESPATQRRSFFAGENAGLGFGFGRAGVVGFDVVGLDGVGVGRGVRGAVGCPAGSAIS